MTEDNALFPKISTLFDSDLDHDQKSSYHDSVRKILKKILPRHIYKGLGEHPGQNEEFLKLLPLVTSTSFTEDSSTISFFVLAEYRPNAFKFFFDMVRQWLIPGKSLNVLLLYAADFRLFGMGSAIYTVCEMMIQVRNPEESRQIKRNLPLLETELRLGMESAYYARRILEIKGLSADEKTALIQEYVTSLAKRLPHEFDQDVMTELQHVLLMCPDEFKAARDCRHLSRIICIHYLFRKAIHEEIKKDPAQRHLSLKLFKGIINFPSGQKRVLGVMVGVNFLKDKEIFDQNHILKAIQNHIPDVRVVEGSFFSNRRGQEEVCTLYMEIEKEDGTDFEPSEIRALREDLPVELKDYIEHWMHSVFMPRNEEEIMRNIVSLSSQIKFLKDMPQVCISFDEQTQTHLFFTVIMVRTLLADSEPIQEMFYKKETSLTYIHDKCKTVGFVRKKYPKEATVFRLKLPKNEYLRRDQSVNLYEARQAVAQELQNVVGEYRDYNGGMITKQTETLMAIRALLDDSLKYNEVLLENFFFSLTPVGLRAFIDPAAFKTLFMMLLQECEERLSTTDEYKLKIQQDSSFVFVMLKTRKRNLKEDLNVLMEQHELTSELGNAYIQIEDLHYSGYIYRCDSHEKQKTFCEILETTVASAELIG